MTADNLATPYPWHTNQWQKITQLHAEAKLPHAILISGARGIGKARFASALAQFLLCDSPQHGQPCGECRGCRLNQAETHPDLMSIEPEEKSKVIKIQQIRALTEFLNNTSQQGGYKVILIEPAEAMNINSANALLKNLEEPAANTLLVLISHAPSYVLPTIRSRCQQYTFPIPGRDQALSWLSPICAPQDPAQLLDLTRGAPLLARELLNGDVLEQRLHFEKELEQLLTYQLSALDAAQNWQKLEPLDVVGWVQMVLHHAITAPYTRTGQELNQLLELLINVKPAILHRLADKLIKLKKQILSGTNPNKQLVLEELAMDWVAMSKMAAMPRQSLVNLLT